MQLIENTSDLKKLCTELAKKPFVCVDLEFLREHTYFAQLCLIQIANPDVEAIVDPLAKELDLQPFFELMQNPEVIKVFHSGRQDIEIIYQQGHCIPSPLFDTQIAASAMGYGESVSYENLVKSLLNINLDKSSRLSDWSKRPLSQEQLQYAICDVTHLAKIYPLIVEKLQNKGRLHWIDDELRNLSSPFLYDVNPYEIWTKIRHRSHSSKFLTLLRELACWREKRAMLKNTPRQSLIKDDILLNICSACPLSKDDLSAVRGMRADLAKGKIGDEIIEVIQNVKTMDKDNYVTVYEESNSLNPDSALLEILRVILHIISAQNNTSPKLIASDDELKQYCSDPTCDVKFMQGWGYEIFGNLVEQVKSGTTAIIYNADKHSIDVKKI